MLWERMGRGKNNSLNNIPHPLITLSQEKVDVNCRDNKGCTPLHYAARQGEAEVVKLLLASEVRE